MPHAAAQEACASGGQCPPGRGYDVKHPSAQLDYFGSLVDIDVQIGRVRSILKQKGYAESTLLWLASDNGPEVNAPNGFIDPVSHPHTHRHARTYFKDQWFGLIAYD